MICQTCTKSFDGPGGICASCSAEAPIPKQTLPTQQSGLLAALAGVESTLITLYSQPYFKTLLFTTVAPLTFFLFFWSIGVNFASSPSYRRPSGITAPQEPQQQMLSGAKSWSFRGAEVTPLASYRIKARVLTTGRQLITSGSTYSPVDLALGWGVMSDTAVLKQLKVFHLTRWYFVDYSEAEIPPDKLYRYSANLHAVPANDRIERQLLDIRTDDLVTLKGYLIQLLTNSTGWSWSWVSSLSREDSGNGACEIMWIEQIDRE